MRAPRACLVLLAACGGGGASPPVDAPPACTTPVPGTTVTARRIASLQDVPLLVTSPPGERRLFVVGGSGRIHLIDDEVVRPAPFIDLSDNNGGPVVDGGERGLLGLAFHPDYARNRRFFVYYTTEDADVIAEYQRDPTDPDRADPASGRVLLSIPDFAANHNGGMIEFGPDGYLYVGTGDGGGGGDPNETAQDPNARLGKILRLDVDRPDSGRPYGIPAGNPYAAGGGAPEVFITGLRNPWRWSFDRATGDLYIGDVGQESVEEIDVVPAATAAGTDLGWDDCEGDRDYEGTGCASPTAPRRLGPVYQEVRPGGGGASDWCSVIGGAVYRGSCYPDLVGRYFFTDYCPGGLWSFRAVIENGRPRATDVVVHPGDFPRDPTSLHEAGLGELYLTDESGGVFRLEAQ